MQNNISSTRQSIIVIIISIKKYIVRHSFHQWSNTNIVVAADAEDQQGNERAHTNIQLRTKKRISFNV